MPGGTGFDDAATGSDQIKWPLSTTHLRACFADAGDDQSMASHSEVVLGGHGIAERLQVLVLELDQLFALLTKQVVVLRVPVVMLVDSSAIERHLPQQSRVHQFFQRSVDCRGAGFLVPLPPQLFDQGVRVEVLVLFVDDFEQCLPLLREAFASALQEFGKSFAG